ncbi:MAG: hypothetical protein UZ07_CHB004002000, partial [Chlorobi bacterium OLB7]
MNRLLLSVPLSLLLFASAVAPLAAQQRQQSKPAVDLRTMQGRPEGLPPFRAPQGVPLPTVQSLPAIIPYGLPERRTLTATPRQLANNTDTATTPRETVMRLKIQRASNGTVRWVEGALGTIGGGGDPKTPARG